MKKYLTVIALCMTILIAAGIGFLYPLSSNDKPAVTTQFPNKIQEVLPSAVHIMCDKWQGSGVALIKDIVVITRHVVDGTNYTITLSDGTKVRGNQAVSHKDYDIGFIKVSKSILQPAEFGSIRKCVLGQPVFIIGSPHGKINFNNVTLGIISGVNKDWDMTDPWTGEKYGWKIAFTSDSAAHPGNSGGPVFSMDGKVRGLLVGGFSPVLNCSMPSDLFMDDIELIKTMFALDKYKVEKPKQVQVVQSREDYYLGD